MIVGCGGLPATPDGASTPDASAEPPGRLAESSALPLEWTPGSPLAPAVVTGRIYDDLAAHAPERMQDLAALGVRVIRIEIERGTPWADYVTIVNAAREAGIEVLAVVSRTSLPLSTPGPLAGTITEFDEVFVPAYQAAIDETISRLDVDFVEIWNEPDVYEFAPMYGLTPGCVRDVGATRYALLATRVFETLDERRRAGMATPTMVAFGVSRQDDGCLREALFDAAPIRNHRLGYRPAHALADGPPTDIVGMHGYGNSGKSPSENGYTYSGGTFATGVEELLAATYADGRPIVGTTPIWYTEVGYSLHTIGGDDPATRQGDALTTVFDVLRAHPQVTAAFWYDYRDDEAGGVERCGLRGASATGFTPHPSYTRMQAAAAINDRAAPAGVLVAPVAGTIASAGSVIQVQGWAIDAEGSPTLEIAIDGQVTASVIDGNAPLASSCTIAWSARCPDGVGFAATVELPPTPGVHEIAVRARDAAGHARVIGRVDIVAR